MALDWEKLNNKVAELAERMERGPRGPSVKWWRPSHGDNNIRVLPAWTDEGPHAGLFFREVAQHWGLSPDQKGPVVCKERTPHLEGDCPVCDLVKTLRANKADAKAQQLAKDIRAKSAYLLSIVDRNDPEYTAEDVAKATASANGEEIGFEVGDLKVQVYAATLGVFNDIISQLSTNKVDFTDAENGHDIVVKKTGSGQFGTNYSVTVIMKSSPVGGTFEAVDLSKVGFTMDDDDLVALLAKGPAGDFLANQLPAETQVESAAEQLAAGEATVASSSAGEDLAAKLAAAASSAQ